MVECNLAKVDVEGSNPFSRSRPELIATLELPPTSNSAHCRANRCRYAPSINDNVQIDHAATRRNRRAPASATTRQFNF